ncbi:MAG: HEPN domain-containing protein [Anaerolineae bacterium]|nr:HEPN domain-containing protein [Anaerolineae bacterium]MCX8067558.1 HEPN domain-containing protein [Anaerolineae bacterium]MDW7991391.1 HEPN domain-containing protein [Anaerolineae bacterium]
MAQRAADWLRQAERDLQQALDSRDAGRHEGACFTAQQAAEKATRALHLHLGQEAWGRVVAHLPRQLPLSIAVPKAWWKRPGPGRFFYIPLRSPNCFVGDAPFEHYGPLHSEEAVQYAGGILEFVRAQMAGPAGGG